MGVCRVMRTGEDGVRGPSRRVSGGNGKNNMGKITGLGYEGVFYGQEEGRI